MGLRKAVHPLLLEPLYWRHRLQEAQSVGRSLLLTPRADLSGRGLEVAEFRIRSHDGLRLWGLMARSRWHADERPARIRQVEIGEVPEIDADTVRSGIAEFVYQVPPGRRLEDRVVDALRVCKMVGSMDGIDAGHVAFACPRDEREPDEFLIAQHLLDGKFC